MTAAFDNTFVRERVRVSHDGDIILGGGLRNDDAWLQRGGCGGGGGGLNIGKSDCVICERSPNVLSKMMVVGKYRPEKNSVFRHFSYSVLFGTKAFTVRCYHKYSFENLK